VAAQDDFYPGYFASTPLGAFDIVASDITAERLGTYPCVLLLGEVDMDPDLHETLREYVAGGGTLIVNALHMIHRSAVVEDEDLLGARLDMGGKYSRVYSSAKIVVTGDIPGVERKEFEEPHFASITAEPKGATVLATDHEDHPVLLEQHFGQGTVYLTTPEYMMEGWKGWKRRLRFFEVFLDAVVPKNIRVESEGDISWVAGRRGGNERIIVLANHGDQSKQATIRIDGALRAGRIEFGNVPAVDEKPGGILSVPVPPEDVVVVSLQEE
jgi:hypothetical protein